MIFSFLSFLSFNATFLPKGLLLPVCFISYSRQRLSVNALLIQQTGTLPASAFLFPGTVAAFLVLGSCCSSSSLYHLLRKWVFLPSSEQNLEVTTSKGRFAFSTLYFYWEICPSGFCCRSLVIAVPGIVVMTALQGETHFCCKTCRVSPCTQVLPPAWERPEGTCQNELFGWKPNAQVQWICSVAPWI